MAKLVVRAKDNSHPDPDVDFRACYKRGDIVAVVEDTHVFGRLEAPPEFEIVDVPGTADEVRYYNQPDPLPPAARMPRAALKGRRLLAALRDSNSPVFVPEMRRRRKWKVDLDDPALPVLRKPIQGV